MAERLMQNHLFKALNQHTRMVELYKRKYSEDRKTRDGKRDWRTYEQRLALRIKMASNELEPIAKEAYSMIDTAKGTMGRPEKVPVYKKVMLLLLKDIFQLSNRKMANLLAMFTALTGIDISYKTVERIYSDELARMVINNMFMIMVKGKSIENADTSGDGTGYSLTVTRHYRNEREKELKSISKTEGHNSTKANGNNGKKRLFVRSFALMDLDTRMYIGYGTSMKSEKEAFLKAKDMAERIGVSINSIRLDKYFSGQSITEVFDKSTTIYIIPKSNATIRGSPEWKRIVRSFVDDQLSHLKEYYKRNSSESGFSGDKRLCGWKIWQKRDDRIDTSLMCKGVWHNLMLLG